MFTYFARPYRLASLLFVLTATPALFAMVRLIQIPAGTLPELAQHLTDTPWSHFLHALTGAGFTFAGILQFSNVLKKRFARVHKITGYVFFACAFILAGSSLHLLLTHLNRSTPILDVARGLAGLGVLISAVLSLRAIWARKISAHMAWAIRCYIFGVGSSTILFLYTPYVLVMGEEPTPLMSDLIFVASWSINLWIGEKVIARRG